MTQAERRSLYMKYAEMMARKAGIEFTPYSKKALVEWMQKELAKTSQ